MQLVGPVGCGKTATVHACAAALGFGVIEVHASMTRSRKQVLDLVGEATRSRALRTVAFGGARDEAGRPVRSLFSSMGAWRWRWLGL